MNTGTIANLNDKGFGFIKVEGAQKDLFFHATALMNGTSFNELKVGDKVNYEDVEDTQKGKSAIGVELA